MWTSLLLFHAFSAVLALPPRSPFEARDGVLSKRANESANFTFEELYALNERFWDNFIFPANVNQTKSINSTLLSDDVIGRIDTTRTLEGRELNTEYIFGTFSSLGLDSSIFSILGVPISHQTTHFSAYENIVSSAELVYFNISIINTIVPVNIDMWFAFNEQGEIYRYDATFRWFEWVFDGLFQTLQTETNSTVQGTQALVTTATTQQTCKVAMQYCTGELQQYDNITACEEFMTQDIRFGKPYEFGHNTLLCRGLHAIMLPLRPAVHCPHVGPTGGDMCVDDLTYEDMVLYSSVGNTSFLPAGVPNSPYLR